MINTHESLKKKADYILFKKVVDLMNDKKHLTQEGLHKIVSIRASNKLKFVGSSTSWISYN